MRSTGDDPRRELPPINISGKDSGRAGSDGKKRHTQKSSSGKKAPRTGGNSASPEASRRKRNKTPESFGDLLAGPRKTRLERPESSSQSHGSKPPSASSRSPTATRREPFGSIPESTPPPVARSHPPPGTQFETASDRNSAPPGWYVKISTDAGERDALLDLATVCQSYRLRNEQLDEEGGSSEAHRPPTEAEARRWQRHCGSLTTSRKPHRASDPARHSMTEQSQFSLPQSSASRPYRPSGPQRQDQYVDEYGRLQTMPPPPVPPWVEEQQPSAGSTDDDGFSAVSWDSSPPFPLQGLQPPSPEMARRSLPSRGPVIGDQRPSARRRRGDPEAFRDV